MSWIDPTASYLDPEGDACDDTARELTDRKAGIRRERARAEYLSRPFCALDGCRHRQTATGPFCMQHLIESFEFGGGKL
jgi:hypothetical protein